MSSFVVTGSADPAMPDDFDAEHARKWDEVLALLRARGAPIGEYGDAVRIYVLSFVEAKRARAHVAEHWRDRAGPDVMGMTPTSRAKVSRAPLLPPPVDGELGTLRLGHFDGAIDVESEAVETGKGK